MAITSDLFETRTMLMALDKTEAFRPKNFLTRTFFPVSEDITGEHVDIDIIKGARRLAPFVNPRHEGKPVEKRAFETRSMKPAYIKMLSTTDAEDFLKRLPGETIYRPGKSGVQYAAERLGKDMQELTDMIARRIEVMAAEVMREGTLTIQGEGVDAEIDFQRDAAHDDTLAGTALWDNAASNPDDNILDWKLMISKATGLNATKMIVGQDALKALLANSKVQAIMDNRRFDLGAIVSQDNLPEGVTFYGTLHGVEIYTYNEWYHDGTTTQPMIPPKEIIMGCTMGHRNALHYGAIKDVEAGVVAVPMFPKSWVTPNPSARHLLIQSAPLIAAHEPDSFLRATVLE